MCCGVIQLRNRSCDTTEKIEQEKLVEDGVQIITGFSCKFQGKRVNIAREMIKSIKVMFIPNSKAKEKPNCIFMMIITNLALLLLTPS